jgi:anti-anti-sigma factor
MGERIRTQPLQWAIAGRADWPSSTLKVIPPAWPGDPLRLSGEADVATEPVLDDSLQSLRASAEGVLVIDLTGLEFIDARSVQLLVSRAQALPEGERMVLQGVRGVVERVLRTLGIENLAPITVVGPQQTVRS